MRLLAVLTIAGSLLLAISAASAQARTAPVARSVGCRASLAHDNTWNKLGPSYVESLTVRGVSCGSGENLIKAYNRCRLAHGGLRGHCGAVDGFRFRESRDTGPDQFVARVTATRSRDSVEFTYSENF